MLSKILSAVFREKSVTSTRETVTFNAPGTYDPKYGKQTIYVTGKGAAGSAGSAYYSYVAGNAYYSYVAGTANYNTISGTAKYNTVAGTQKYNTIPGTANYNTVAGYSYLVYNTVSGTANYNTTAPRTIKGYNAPYTLLAGGLYNPPTYPVAGYNAPAYPTAGYNAPTYPTAGYNAPTYPTAGYNAPTYPYAGTNPASYPYAGTNPSNTGASASAFGVTFPGGYGTTATVVPNTTVIATYGTAVPITVPSGAYVTVSTRVNDSDAI